MDRQFTLGYNEGLNTASRVLLSIAADLKDFKEQDKLDAQVIIEIVDGLKDLYLDVEGD